MDKTAIISPDMGVAGSNESLNAEYVSYVLDAIFSPGPVRDLLKSGLVPEHASFLTLNDLFGRLRGFFSENLSNMFQKTAFAGLEDDILYQASRLGNFERRFKVDAARYDITGKRDANIIFWPNPSHAQRPSSLFEQLPYTESIPLLDKTTPIGSAGSCFASEIAWYLQNSGFNYIIEEFDPRDAPKPETPARWGIIFNTPSFRQLAEKAFGLRHMPRLAEYHSAGKYWQDPFRENVVFSSVDELDASRKSHLEACRRTFMKCKVFVITLGLNECWEFIPDGSVASRNPKTDAHYALFRHRVLTVSENVENLQCFLDVLRQHNSDIQIIVTLSPVPFMATGLGAEKHVVTANAHSKAVLRVAADEFVRTNEGTFYFPSFEMVTHCIKHSWDTDQRHIRRDAITRIMNLFKIMFVRGEQNSAEKLS